MKLGGKGKDVESFVDQLKSEGETVIAQTPNSISQSGLKIPTHNKQDIDEYVFKIFVCYKFVISIFFVVSI